MPTIRIPKYSKALWTEKVNILTEVLISAQLLFLNNFCEPLCKKSKDILKAVLDKFRLKDEELIVGDIVMVGEEENHSYCIECTV